MNPSSSPLRFRVGIKAIAYQLGGRLETNADLVADNPDWRMPEIEAKTGVTARHVADPDQTASDLAAAAAEALFSRGIDRTQVDALLFVSQSLDYFLPTTACVLQHRLQLPKACLAFDINQGCSGFVYGLGVAASLVHSGLANRVLLLCGDTYRRFIDRHDRTSRPIFSDGAAAALVERVGDERVGPFAFGSDGAGAANLIVPTGGARQPTSASGVPPQLAMNGPHIFTFTMAAVPALVNSVLRAGGITVDQVDLFVFHQASALVLQGLQRKLNLPAEKVYSNLARTGNTVSATIPIALVDAESEGRLRPDHTVLICGFGVGYSWAAGLVKWQPLQR